MAEWIDCQKQLPTEADGFGHAQDVFCWWRRRDGKYAYSFNHWSRVKHLCNVAHFGYISHWQRIIPPNGI
jgi:hypothetical protein